MHRSRLRQLVIDCPPDVHDATTRFWAAALGADSTPHGDPDYTRLVGHSGGDWSLLTQRLGAGTAARLHLDIETDDVAAEVARLLALGAEEVERVESWVVLRDPAGLLFCVINAQAGFDSATTTWE